ncbi:MAG: hypothetical protein ACE5EN_10435 [Nitrospinota bacterium]
MVIFNMVLVGFHMVGTAIADGVSLIPSLRLGEQWDSNPFLTGEGGDIKQDFITEISPQLAVRSLSTRTQYSGSYRLDSRQYSRLRELDYISHTGNIAVESEPLPETSLSASDTYRFTPDSLEASDVGVQTSRDDIVSNFAFATLSRSLSSAGSVSLTLENTMQDFQDESLFDTRTDSASLSGSYIYSLNTAFTMSYRYTKNHYASAVGESSTETHSAQLGVSNQLSPGVSISVSGGAAYTDGLDKAPNWTTSASYAKAFQATSFNMDYSRSVTNTSGLTNEINIRDSVSIDLNRTFGRSFSANLGGSLLKNRSEPSNNVDRTSYTANAGFAWRVLEWLSVDARYTRFQQWVDDLLGVSMARDQVFIGLTATPNELRF